MMHIWDDRKWKGDPTIPRMDVDALMHSVVSYLQQLESRIKALEYQRKAPEYDEVTRRLRQARYGYDDTGGY
jgi:hypothetical protein